MTLATAPMPDSLPQPLRGLRWRAALLVVLATLAVAGLAERGFAGSCSGTALTVADISLPGSAGRA
jgi:hypothetical protein